MISFDFTGEMSLDKLHALHTAFLKADENQNGRLSLEEFSTAFSSVITSANESDIKSLFCKIDTNSDGVVDWEEFSNYLLLSSATQATENGLYEMGEMIAMPRNSHVTFKELIDVCFHEEGMSSYIVGSRDGLLKIFNARTFSCERVLDIRSGSLKSLKQKVWVTCISILTARNLLAVGTTDRLIYFFDMGTFDRVNQGGNLPAGRYGTAQYSKLAQYFTQAYRACTPLCMHAFSADITVGERRKSMHYLIYGDERGSLHFVDQLTLRPVLNARGIHNNWITKVQYLSDVGMVLSVSLDRYAHLFDIQKRTVVRSFCEHSKGITSFTWCAALKMIASCGNERDVLLWNPYTLMAVGSLKGHTSSVQDVFYDSVRTKLLITLGTDKTIIIWDPRNHTQINVLRDFTAYRPENKFSAAAFDAARGQLLLCTRELHARSLLYTGTNSQNGRAHKSSVVAALYSNFSNQLVTIDVDANVCVWDTDTGERRFYFRASIGEPTMARITTAGFDSVRRRLLLGSEECSLRAYNFSSGQWIHTLQTPGGSQCISVLAVSRLSGGREGGFIAAAGWDRIIWVYSESMERFTCPPVRCINASVPLQDILSLAYVQQGAVSTLLSGSLCGHLSGWNVESSRAKFHIQAIESRDDTAVDIIVPLNRKPPFAVSCGADGVVRVWNAFRDREEIQTSSPYGLPLSALSTDDTNSFIVAADTEGHVLVWDISQLSIVDVRSPILLYSWQAHDEAVSSVSIIEDERGRFSNVVMTATSDGSVCCWTLSGKKIGALGSTSLQWCLLNSHEDVSDDVRMANEEDGDEARISQNRDAGAEESNFERRSSPGQLKVDVETDCQTDVEIEQLETDEYMNGYVKVTPRVVDTILKKKAWWPGSGNISSVVNRMSGRQRASSRRLPMHSFSELSFDATSLTRRRKTARDDIANFSISTREPKAQAHCLSERQSKDFGSFSTTRIDGRHSHAGSLTARGRLEGSLY